MVSFVCAATIDRPTASYSLTHRYVSRVSLGSFRYYPNSIPLSEIFSCEDACCVVRAWSDLVGFRPNECHTMSHPWQRGYSSGLIMYIIYMYIMQLKMFSRLPSDIVQLPAMCRLGRGCWKGKASEHTPKTYRRIPIKQTIN